MTSQGDRSDATSIGVVYGDGYDADVRPEAVVDRAGATAVVGDADAVLDADPSLVVALGEGALLDLVRAGVGAPVLPVDAGRGVRSVPSGSFPDALAAVFADDWTTATRRGLSVAANGRNVATAFMDVMLVTSEPARISEYRVSTPARPVARFRADGVVVATPQGSHGYNRNLDGPLLAPETDAVSVVPVAPFAIDHEQWVLDADAGVSLSIERDEGSVSLFVDDRRVERLGLGDEVEIVAGDEVEIVETPASGAMFGGEGA